MNYTLTLEDLNNTIKNLRDMKIQFYEEILDDYQVSFPGVI